MARMKFQSRTDRIFYKLDRERILVEQDNKCRYCGCKLSRKEATTDHVIALSRVGRVHSTSNTVVACEDCNSRKGSKKKYKPDAWTLYLQRVEDRLRERTKLAVYRLDMKPKGGGSYNKWKKYWEKRGRWK